MGVPRVTTCCFIFDLKTGTTIIGVFSAVLSFMVLVMLIAAAAVFESLQNNLVIELDPDAEAEATGRYVISVMLIILYVAKFISDLMFIYAVVTERRGIIKMYGIVWLVFFLLSSFLFFIHIMDFEYYTIISELIYIAINIYAAILAYNFYQDINTREEL